MENAKKIQPGQEICTSVCKSNKTNNVTANILSSNCVRHCSKCTTSLHNPARQVPLSCHFLNEKQAQRSTQSKDTLISGEPGFKLRQSNSRSSTHTTATGNEDTCPQNLESNYICQMHVYSGRTDNIAPKVLRNHIIKPP